jgi:hypothetical protein
MSNVSDASSKENCNSIHQEIEVIPPFLLLTKAVTSHRTPKSVAR